MVLDVWQLAELDDGTRDVPELDNTNWFTEQTKERLQKRNFVVLLTGDTGSGKSLLGQALLEAVDQLFNLNDVYFDELLFFEMVRDLAKKAVENDTLGLPEPLDITPIEPKGPVTWENLGEEIHSDLAGRGSELDEGGITADPLRWNSIVGRALKSVMETFRYQKQVVVVAVPLVELVNINIRRLCHAWIRVTRTGFAVVYGIETKRDKETWEKRRPIKYGTLSNWDPPQRIPVQDYWKKKHRSNLVMLDNLYDEMQKRLDEIRGKGMVPKALPPPRIEPADDKKDGPYR